MKYVFKDLSQQQIQNIVGVGDHNLQFLEELYDCGIVYRDDYFNLLSDDKELNEKFKKQLDYLVSLSGQDEIDYDVIRHSFLHNEILPKVDLKKEIIAYSFAGKPFKAKTIGQQRFINTIRDNDLTFCIGPAGTGKTFLSVLMAASYLKKGKTNKIIITRPAVEAGESLGFLPGDLKEKIDPYLMPIYDALDEIFGSEQKDKMIEKGTIEVIPLAYMRGRTLNEAFIILDEAQNTTDKQMLMFLTRLGFQSKMVVNGDITQIDLNIRRNASGLMIAYEKLKEVKNIGFVEFSGNDVVRNPLVQTIIEKFTIE